MDGKGSSFSKLSNIRDNYDKLMEDKRYNQGDENNFLSNPLMSQEEQEFYGSSSRLNNYPSQTNTDLNWTNEYIYQPISRNDERYLHSENMVNDFQNTQSISNDRRKENKK